jgi:hypothetical protein
VGAAYKGGLIHLFHRLRGHQPLVPNCKVILADWISAYNTEHPHSALGMMPPARFAARWRAEKGAPPPRSSRPPGSLHEAVAVDATVPGDTNP